MPPRPTTYLQDIPPLHREGLGLPATLGSLDLNRPIAAGSQIDSAHLEDAKKTAKVLKSLHKSQINNVSKEAVERADLRASYLTSEHARVHYAPIGFDQILQRLDELGEAIADISQEVKIVRAQNYNNRIIARNRRTLPGSCLPLQKTVPGQNAQQANTILAIVRVGRGGGLAVPDEAPAIGTIPDNFNPDISAYTIRDIAKMALFYNEDFGIDAQDSEAQAKEKFRSFLSLL